MKSLKRIVEFIIIIGIIFLSNKFIAYASNTIPTELIINTGNSIVGSVDYKGYTLSAYKIFSKAGLGYCLEIDKDYPSGQIFKLKGDCTQEVTDILIAGYPNRSVEELNLKSDDEAYFATQIAIWSEYEGYDIYKFSGSNERVLKAIIDIYEKSKNVNKVLMTYEGKEYYYDEYTQDVVMLFNKIEVEPPTPPVNPEPPIPPVEPPTPPVEPSVPPVNPNPPTTPELPQTGYGNYYNYIGFVGVVFISAGMYLFLIKIKVQ